MVFGDFNVDLLVLSKQNKETKQYNKKNIVRETPTQKVYRRLY